MIFLNKLDFGIKVSKIAQDDYQIAGHFIFGCFMQHLDGLCGAFAVGLDTAVTSFCRVESYVSFPFLFGFGVWAAQMCVTF